MAFVNALTDGTSVNHTELMPLFGFETERAVKNFIAKYDIEYEPVNGKWVVAIEDVRSRLRGKAKTHKQRQAEKQAKLGIPKKPSVKAVRPKKRSEG